MNPYLSWTPEELAIMTNAGKFAGFAKNCRQWGIDPSKSTLIDVGCGHGQTALALSWHFKTVKGIDSSTAMLEYARSLKQQIKAIHDRLFHNCRFYRGNFRSIQGKFQVALLFNSIHYSKDVMNDLRYIHGKLDSGGLLIIKEPTCNSKFGASQLNNPSTSRQRKLETLAATRHHIDQFKIQCNGDGDTIMVEKNADKFYLLVIRKHG